MSVRRRSAVSSVNVAISISFISFIQLLLFLKEDEDADYVLK